MKKTILPVLLLLFSPIVGWASNCDGLGNCYIYGAATGSGNGSSWTNACTGFTGTCAPSNMTRGVTYWIAAGTYTAPTFSTATSGTSVITIEAATTSNHGPDSTWSSSYAGVATISGVTTISTSYWTFNGQTRGSDWRSGYNIYFDNTSGSAGSDVEIDGSNVTVEYVQIEGSNSNYTCSNCSDNGVNVGGGASNLYIGYSWIHDCGCDLIYYTSTGTGAGTFEYNMIERNHTGGGCHSQAITLSDDPGPIIIRYNYFRDITNTGVIDNDNSNGTTFTPQWYIYGNTNYWTTSVYTGADAGQSTDCMLGLFGQIMNGGVIQIFNNTIAAINAPACQSGEVDCGEVMLATANAGSPCSSDNYSCCGTTCPTISVYNNLFWNNFSAGDVALGSGNPYTVNYGYGEFYCPSTGCSNGGSYSLAGTDVGSNTGNPFVNFDGSSNFNFELSADTTPGYSIPNWSTTPSGCTSGTNCENTDPLGIIRGANGTIDRGAFQISGGATPDPPTNLTATPH